MGITQLAGLMAQSPDHVRGAKAAPIHSGYPLHGCAHGCAPCAGACSLSSALLGQRGSPCSHCRKGAVTGALCQAGERAVAAQVGAVLRGTVASVKPYGIFVRLEGFRANALVHLSQASALGCHLSVYAAQQALELLGPAGPQPPVSESPVCCASALGRLARAHAGELAVPHLVRWFAAYHMPCGSGTGSSTAER